MNKKILLIQPGYAHYRDELFSILSKRHDFFVLYERKKSVYPGGELPKEDNYKFINQTSAFKWFDFIMFLLRYNPDVVITSISSSLRTFIAYLYSKIFRKKFILWILEWREPVYDENTFRGKIRRFRRYIAKIIILECDVLIVGGSASYKYALSLGKKSVKIFTALQCAKDLHKEDHNRISKNGEIVFIYLSRIIKWKGLDYLIKAFSRLENDRNNVKLIIAGDGPFKKECVELCGKLKTKKIKFIGSVDSKDVHNVYVNANIFVLPSIVYKNSCEAWGLVLNEAMSMMLPVITTDAVGASYDLIKGNGTVVKNADVDELYQAMKNMLAMDIDNLGLMSRKIFEEKNNYTKMADGFTGAIEYVTEKES